ncbi:MAG TPA: uridine kinase, partial [Myxococcales bacterium]
MATPLVVGIAGGSSSGKTTVALKLKSALAEYRVAMIDQDAYYRDLSHLTLVQRRE